ncbi:N-methyl-L-tryptophan oxidase [Bosea caraganae]|uniref:N-methyl-L-tryptophan oxidase n=1 Tax=Bosea caraganae TaxID=2763117 RepID=A0A370L2E4_9HYPH|nr:N-methyl-L-tryptophan oxidase [Bosea caraganae]RDJ22405.1 N-methyl-L-tryptophan oxidase [Bosea caraganae]RDJ30364.1 N-methyl-L-tryptophan oxidase [Bosea caraganae]
MIRQTADVVVLGLGAMGSATLFQLASRGADVLGVDQFHPPHELGSSHGETRVTRLAVAEGTALAPLVRRSHEIWKELEARTGESLFGQVGFLAISSEPPRSGAADYIERTLAVAQRGGVAHELIDPAEARRRHPWLNVAESDRIYFEPEGGYLRPERCVAAQLRLATEAGARLALDTRVGAIIPRGDHVEIETDKGTILAGRVVVSAGAWAGQLLGAGFSALLRPTREILHWYDLEPSAPAEWAQAPVYIWSYGPGAEQGFYGFPASDGAVKVAHGEKTRFVDPDSFDRSSEEAESRDFYARAIDGRLKGLRADASRRKTCLYTVSPDGGFVIDHWPESERVLVVSPCSGHGFKHSAAIGEAVSQRLLDGASRIDLSAFGLERFSVA